jgi:DnaJ family protein C protein 3
MWLNYMLLAAAAAPAVLAGARPGSARPGGKELRPLTRRGDVALAAGQFNDATRAYSEALELAPESYLLLYKRATAYMSQNQHSRALADLDRVLEFTGDGFDKALFMKARLFAQEGKWAEATKFANQYTVKNKGDNAAVDLVSETALSYTFANRIQAIRSDRGPSSPPQRRKSSQEQALGHLR